MTEPAQSVSRPDVKFPVDDKSRAETLDDQDEQEIFNFGFVQRAVPKLGKSGSVSVVLDKYREPELFTEHLAQRNVDPFEIRRHLDGAGFSIDKARDAYAD